MSVAAGNRRGLRPDTFPFLAVLLCAMGALILLLLVMDRRAKAVARAKAMQARARVAEEDAKLLAAKQEEWEQRRAALRAALQQQSEEVQGTLREVSDKTTAAVVRLRGEQARTQELAAQIHSQQRAIQERQRILTEQKERANEDGQQSEKAHAERLRLAAELEQVERTLADLKTLRQRSQQTYSVVPYRGRQGDHRKPLYVEASAAGLVFHPDRKVLEGSDLTPVGIRAELERRVTRQPTNAEGSAKPYFLVLVRPAGISTYYRMQAALAGLQADFGYELVDADWILEFPEAEKPLPRGTNAEPREVARFPTPSQGVGSSSIQGTGSRGTGVGSSSDVGLSGTSGVTGTLMPVAPSSGVPTTAGNQGVGSSMGGGGRDGRQGENLPPHTSPPVAGAMSGQSASLAPPSLLGAPLPGKSVGGAPSPESEASSPSAGAHGSMDAASPTRLSPRGLPPSDAKPAPRRSNTRDWIIAVECRGDAFVIYPGATRIPLTTLSVQTDGENALTKTIRQEIARRQALMPSGEASQRPHVRFLVRPDGTRAYYRAFPLLEGLGVSMTRQNLDAEEDVGLEHVTR